MPELGWAGPGHLCEADFTLKVEANEYVREDVQLEPSYPASNTIKSEAGWFTISTPALKPRRPERRFRIAADRLGALYEHPDGALDKRFVFFPATADRPAIEVKFHKIVGTPGGMNWMTAPQRSFPSQQYEAVLRRLVFARTHPDDCINPQIWDDRK